VADILKSAFRRKPRQVASDRNSGRVCGDLWIAFLWLRPWPSVTTTVWYSAPPQSNYPIHFYAEIESDLKNGTAPTFKEIIFSKAAPTRPWLIAYLGSFNSSAPLFAYPSAVVTASQNIQTPPGRVPRVITETCGCAT
jgi:hypothetical protein